MNWGASASSPSASRSLTDAVVQDLFEIDEGVVRPEPFPELFARYQFSRVFQQHRQHVDGMAAELESLAVVIQLPRVEIELEGLEANEMF